MRAAATYHAITVGRERCGIDRATIEREVLEAVAAGRRSKVKPRFLTYGQDRGGDVKTSTRYCWNEERTRGYVIKPGGDGDKVWVVVTVLVPAENTRVA